MQTARAGLVAGAGKHLGSILCPGLCGRRVIAAREHLQLQCAAGCQLIGRRGHLGGNFQTQQSLLRHCTRRRGQGLAPCGAHACGDLSAQFLRARQLLGIATLPCGQQLRQCLSMGLRGELAQGTLCVLHGIALRPEGGITQARATRGRRLTIAATSCGITRAACITHLAAIPSDAAATGLRHGFGLAHAGAIIATYGHHRARRDGRRRLGIGRLRFRINSFLRLISGRFRLILLEFCSLSLLPECRLQGGHSGTDFLRIAGCIGGFQGLGRLQHRPVARAQLLGIALTLGRLAIEGLINGLAKGIPELLFLLSIQGDGLGLCLPALLQRLDGVNAQ